MKKTILLLVGIFIINATIKGQNNGNLHLNQHKMGQKPQKSPELRAKNDAEKVAQKLGLDAEQKMKWQAASLERMKANEPLRAQLNDSTTKSEKQQIVSQIKVNTNKFDNNVNGFLSAEQKIKWEALKQEKKESRKSKKKYEQTPPVAK